MCLFPGMLVLISSQTSTGFQCKNMRYKIDMQHRSVLKRTLSGVGTAVVGHAEALADIPRAVREETGRQRVQWRVKRFVVRGAGLLGCFWVDITPVQHARGGMRSRGGIFRRSPSRHRSHVAAPRILCFHGAVSLGRDVAQILEARATCNLARADVAVGLEVGPWTLRAEEREALGRRRRAKSHVGVQPPVAALCFRVRGEHRRVPIRLSQKVDVNRPATLRRCAIWHRVERPCAKYACVSLVAATPHIETKPCGRLHSCASIESYSVCCSRGTDRGPDLHLRKCSPDAWSPCPTGALPSEPQLRSPQSCTWRQDATTLSAWVAGRGVRVDEGSGIRAAGDRPRRLVPHDPAAHRLMIIR